MNNEFDLESFHDSEIAPRMQEIIDLCKSVGLPMVASFALRNREGVARLSTTYIPGVPGGELRAPPAIRRALAAIKNN